MPGPGFEPGLLRPQRSVLTTRRSRRATKEEITQAAETIASMFRKSKKMCMTSSMRLSSKNQSLKCENNCIVMI